MFKNLNINPFHRRADDCTVRAIATVLGKTWEEVYADICIEGLRYYDMPSANHVWGSYLRKHGYVRHIIPDTCPNCYTVKEFSEDHPEGKYILCMSGHVTAVIDGDVYDSWDCLDKIPIYYWTKED